MLSTSPQNRKREKALTRRSKSGRWRLIYGIPTLKVAQTGLPNATAKNLRRRYRGGLLVSPELPLPKVLGRAGIALRRVGSGKLLPIDGPPARDRPSRPDDARALVQQVIAGTVDPSPDAKKDADRAAAPVKRRARDEILRHLYAQLTATDTFYSGIELRPVCSLVRANQSPRDQPDTASTNHRLNERFWRPN